MIRPRTILLTLTSLAITVACSGKVAATLAERRTFQGQVEIREPAAGAPLIGELSFARDTRHLQWTERAPDMTVSRLRLPGGELRVFRNGLPTPATDEDRAAIARVAELVDAAADAVVSDRRADGYRVAWAGREIEVRVRVEAPAHGARGHRP